MRVQYDTPIQDVTPTLSNEGKGETVYFSILIINPCFHLPLLSATTIITQTRSSNPSILPSRTAPKKRNRNHVYTKPLLHRNNARRNHHRRHRKARPTVIQHRTTRIPAAISTRTGSTAANRKHGLATASKGIERRKNNWMIGSYALDMGCGVWSLLVYMGDAPYGSLSSVLFRYLKVYGG